MLKTNATFRAEARATLQGNWKPAVLATLVYLLVYGIFAAGSSCSDLTGNAFLPMVGSLGQIFIGFPLAFGFYIAILRFYRGEKEQMVGNIFDGFNNYGRALGASLLVHIYTFLWTLLLIVPGIIKFYAYSQTYFILHDNPEMGINDAIDESMRMMNGHKEQLFMLDLSFIGWILLGILSCGIGLLWIEPYCMNAHAAFYENLKMEDLKERILPAE